MGTGTGLARYTSELVSALLSRPNGDIHYVVLVRNTAELPDIRLPHRILLADIPHYSLAEQTKLPALLKASGADLAFFPHFNAPFFCPIPFVATVHDLILHRHPGDVSFLKQAAYRVLVHRALRRAKAIIAVSQWTKDDVAANYGPAVAKKTTVIGEGVNESFMVQPLARIEDVRMRYGLQRPFFLYVGNCKPHKNVPMLLDAFSLARPDADLLLVSGGADARALRLPPNVRLLEGVPDDDLPLLYGAARCFVTASLEEGYCLPIAEALACGCPVIGTNRAAIPEILDGHGVLVEPTVEAFEAAFGDPPTLAAPVRIGNWEKAADETEQMLLAATRR